jgi:glycosyltransferase involved in cell wall biosynthesis
MAKIMVVVPDLRLGGFEKNRVQLSNYFFDQGHDVIIVALGQKGDLSHLLNPDITFLTLDGVRSIGAIRALSRVFREHQPDATLAGLWPLTFLVAVSYAITGRSGRLVITEHNQLSLQYNDWGSRHRLLLRATLAFACRVSSANGAVSLGVVYDTARLAMLNESKFHVLFNPLRVLPDPSKTEKDAAETSWRKPRGHRVLTVGTLKAQKNHKLLIDAVARLGKDMAQLIIVGDGPMRIELEDYIKKRGLEDRCQLVGKHDNPSAFFQSADLFVLSSNYEGLPNVVIEALSFGLPVVSTDCPSGPNEILDGGRFGELVPVGDAEALSRAIEAKLNASSESNLLKERAAEFSLERSAKRYLSLLIGETC